MRNIQVVDDIIQKTENLLSEFYQDDETSYIFTADHGMSVIGNHGDGGNAHCAATDAILTVLPLLQTQTIPGRHWSHGDEVSEGLCRTHHPPLMTLTRSLGALIICCVVMWNKQMWPLSWRLYWASTGRSTRWGSVPMLTQLELGIYRLVWVTKLLRKSHW